MGTSSRGLQGTLELVFVICLYSNLYTYKAFECKRAIIRLHSATSKSSLWNMGYVARGGAFECPRIYRTSIHIDVYVAPPILVGVWPMAGTLWQSLRIL